MKKCPSCAEEIQEEAIACRYCGHELVVPIWKQGAKAAVVVTAMYILSVPWISNSPSEVTTNLINGTPATFVAWWALAALFVWIWRKSAMLSLLPKLFLMAAYAVVFLVLSNFLVRMGVLFLRQ